MSAPALTPLEVEAAQAAAAAAAEKFNIEAFTLLGIGLTVTILRTIARVKAVGWRNFGVDDYLAWAAAVFYAMETSLAYSVGNAAHGLANNGMTPEERSALSPDDPEYALRILGSKIQLAGWTIYGTLLWLLKGSLLVFYTRLTAGLGRNYEIRIYVGYGIVIVSYLVVIFNLFFGCRGFHKYWQINPDPGNVCQPAVSNQIVWVYFGFNVVTDMYLLSIPLPMLWQSSLKRWKKFGLMILFGGGILVIASATLRCVLIVSDPINGAQLAGSWAVRETFIALVTTNLPLVYPLFHMLFGRYISSLVSTMRSTQKHDETPKNFEFVTIGGGGGKDVTKGSRSNPITNVTFSESEERMMGTVEMQNWSESGSHGHNASIQKDVEVAVVTHEMSGQEIEEDQQRQQAVSSLEESMRQNQGHFTSVEASSKKNGNGEV